MQPLHAPDGTTLFQGMLGGKIVHLALAEYQQALAHVAHGRPSDGEGEGGSDRRWKLSDTLRAALEAGMRQPDPAGGSCGSAPPLHRILRLGLGVLAPDHWAVAVCADPDDDDVDPPSVQDCRDHLKAMPRVYIADIDTGTWGGCRVQVLAASGIYDANMSTDDYGGPFQLGAADAPRHEGNVEGSGDDEFTDWRDAQTQREMREQGCAPATPYYRVPGIDWEGGQLDPTYCVANDLPDALLDLWSGFADFPLIATWDDLDDDCGEELAQYCAVLDRLEEGWTPVLGSAS